MQVFFDLGEDEYKLMRLDYHIMSEKSNDMCAYRVAKFLKDKLSFSSANLYIHAQIAQKKFEEWYAQQKKKDAGKTNDGWREDEDSEAPRRTSVSLSLSSLAVG